MNKPKITIEYTPYEDMRKAAEVCVTWHTDPPHSMLYKLKPSTPVLAGDKWDCEWLYTS